LKLNYSERWFIDLFAVDIHSLWIRANLRSFRRSEEDIGINAIPPPIEADSHGALSFPGEFNDLANAKLATLVWAKWLSEKGAKDDISVCAHRLLPEVPGRWFNQQQRTVFLFMPRVYAPLTTSALRVSADFVFLGSVFAVRATRALDSP
jgi:hypothetical protein